ncbi:NAD(P)/FAD-dependent oxidoreductase [Zhouia sp. PK063]|uniref:NAD(P)/FAD-dependent oxidoreductase n=1 Tax=Zhouia sp. PK063 TaxID=3373602 RepID=UPI0037B6006C
MNIPQSSFPRIVVIGGGFAGLTLAKNLANKEAQIVLLDKHNYHTFQPLLYQVSTGGLEPDSIAYPLRKILKAHKHSYFRLADVSYIDTDEKIIHSDIGELTYDYLVIATGSTTNFFGNKNMEENSMVMKTIPQALNLRSLLLENFEDALLTPDLNERDALMNFVIVGGGPTGVELAGALAEIKNSVLPEDYPDLDIRRMQINLIQSGDQLLDAMSDQASEKAEKFLKKMGVSIYKNVRVNDYDGKHVTTNSDLSFESVTLIWTAGVKGASIKGIDAADVLTKSSRIKVDQYNQVLGYPRVFAIGDIAAMTTEDFPHGHPMMAQPAIQQGKHLSKNIIRLLKGKEMKPFDYFDKGSMATVGRNKAVVDLHRIRFQGVFAWFVWMFIHLWSLIGFRNRLVVFVNWVYNYIKFDTEVRLIIRPYKRNSHKKHTEKEAEIAIDK